MFSALITSLSSDILGLFVEKQSEPHLIKETLDFYQIPLRMRPGIKQGADFITEDGTVVPNKYLVRPANPPRRYAYCSDTAYSESIIPLIEGADLLYHEATFAETEAKRAKETFHSTARQAAEIARRAQVKKLVIGHYSARYENITPLLQEAREIFPETVSANEGMKLSI